MLRYQYVLANTGAATGDFQRTIGSWANQLRLLTGSFEQLGGIVGGVLVNAFKPFIAALNQVMSAVISFAKVVSDALGAIFGWEYQTGGGVANDLAAGAGAAEEIEDATGGAADNAKKLNRYIAAWHEVNNMTSNEGSGGSGGGGGGGLGGATGAADGGQWVQAESLWEKYTSEIDTLYELGDYIGGVLTDAMNDIDWDSVYRGASNFGTGLAQFLNGLISPELFGATGRTVAGALNTAIYAALAFGTEFDWDNLGLSVATGINEFFATYDFESSAETFNVWAKGLLDFLITTVDNIDGREIGEGIGTWFETIDYVEIMGKVARLIWKALNLGLETYISMFSVAPIETALLTLLNVFKASRLRPVKDFGTTIQLLSTTLKTSADKIKNIGTLFSTAWEAIGGNKTAQSALTFLSPNLAKAITDIQQAFARSGLKGALPAALKNVNTSLKDILGNLSPMAKLVGGVATAFIEFNVINDSMSNIAQGTGNFVIELGKIAGVATAAGYAMSAMFGPAGIAFAAVIGIAGAIKGLYEGSRQLAEDSSIGQYSDALESAADTLKQKTADIEDNLKEIQESIATAGGSNAQYLQDLVKEYEELQGKTNLTADEQNRMKQIMEELSEVFPELKEHIDEETGAYDGQIDVIDDLIRKKQLLAQQNAAQQQLTELYNEQYEAQQNLKKAQDEQQKALDDFVKTYDGLDKTVKDLVASGDTLGLLDLYYADIQGENGKGALKEHFGTSNSLAVKEMINSLIESVDQYDTAVEDAKEKITEINTAIQDTSALDSFFGSLAEGIQVGAEQLKSAFNALGVELPDAFIVALSDKAPEVQLRVSELLMNVSNGVQADGAELQQLFTDLGIQIPQSLTDELAKQDAFVQEATITLLANVKSGYSLSQPELLNLFDALGLDIPEELIKSLASKTSEVQDQTLTLLGQIEEGEKLKDSDLKTLFSNLGIELPDNLITSLQSKEGEAYTQAVNLLMQLPNASADKKDDILKELNNLGISEGQSLIDGVNSKETEYKQAGIDASKSVATGASEEAKKTGEGSIYKAGESTGTSFFQGLKDKLSWFANNSFGDLLNQLFGGRTVSVNAKVNTSGGGSGRSRMVQVESQSSPISTFSAGPRSVLAAVNNIATASMNGYSVPVPRIRTSLGRSAEYVNSGFTSTKYNNIGSASKSLYMDFQRDGIDYGRMGEAFYEAASQVARENPVQIGDDDVYHAAQRAQRRDFKRTNRTGWAGIG